MRNFWNRLFGRNVLINTRTDEAHDLRVDNKRCKRTSIKDENRKYVSKRKFKKLMKENKKLNGCNYCMPKYDK